MTDAHKRRVLLKLSGEAFGGGSLGVNPDVVSELAKEIAAAAQDVEIAIVVGGGNFFRGAELSQRGMDRGRADYMGMLGTVMNALALQDFLEQAGAATRVQSAISRASALTTSGLTPRDPPPKASPESLRSTRRLVWVPFMLDASFSSTVFNLLCPECGACHRTRDGREKGARIVDDPSSFHCACYAPTLNRAKPEIVSPASETTLATDSLLSFA